MAEEPQIIIFPRLRISELKQDIVLKKQRLDSSTASVKQTVLEKVRPLNFLIENRRMILGAFTSAFTALTVVKRLRKKPKKSETPADKPVISGWIRQLAGIGGILAIKTLAPAVISLVKYGVKNAFKNSRN